MAAPGRYPGHSHRVTRAATTRKVDDGLTRAVVRWFFGGGAVHELDGTAPGSAVATARLSALRILAGASAGWSSVISVFEGIVGAVTARAFIVRQEPRRVTVAPECRVITVRKETRMIDA